MTEWRSCIISKYVSLVPTTKNSNGIGGMQIWFVWFDAITGCCYFLTIHQESKTRKSPVHGQSCSRFCWAHLPCSVLQRPFQSKPTGIFHQATKDGAFESCLLSTIEEFFLDLGLLCHLPRDTIVLNSFSGQFTEQVTFVPPPKGMRTTLWVLANSTMNSTSLWHVGQRTISGIRSWQVFTRSWTLWPKLRKYRSSMLIEQSIPLFDISSRKASQSICTNLWSGIAWFECGASMSASLMLSKSLRIVSACGSITLLNWLYLRTNYTKKLSFDLNFWFWPHLSPLKHKHFFSLS